MEFPGITFHRPAELRVAMKYDCAQFPAVAVIIVAPVAVVDPLDPKTPTRYCPAGMLDPQGTNARILPIRPLGPGPGTVYDKTQALAPTVELVMDTVEVKPLVTLPIASAIERVPEIV